MSCCVWILFGKAQCHTAWSQLSLGLAVEFVYVFLRTDLTATTTPATPGSPWQELQKSSFQNLQTLRFMIHRERKRERERTVSCSLILANSCPIVGLKLAELPPAKLGGDGVGLLGLLT